VKQLEVRRRNGRFPIEEAVGSFREFGIVIVKEYFPRSVQASLRASLESRLAQNRRIDEPGKRRLSRAHIVCLAPDLVRLFTPGESAFLGFAVVHAIYGAVLGGIYGPTPASLAEALFEEVDE